MGLCICGPGYRGVTSTVVGAFLANCACRISNSEHEKRNRKRKGKPHKPVAVVTL